MQIEIHWSFYINYLSTIFNFIHNNLIKGGGLLLSPKQTQFTILFSNRIPSNNSLHQTGVPKTLILYYF